MNDDLISRKALQNAVEISCEGCKVKSHYCGDCPTTRFLDLIRDAQPIDAYPFEQVKELVELNQEFAKEIANMTIPQADRISQDECTSKNYLWTFCERCGTCNRIDHAFCHNCGAKMKNTEGQ